MDTVVIMKTRETDSGSDLVNKFNNLFTFTNNSLLLTMINPY
jgi:hypothetical protein